MNDRIQLSRDRDVAIVTINNPPVNVLSPGVPEAIAEVIEQIAKDDDVNAVVLIGGGRTFVAGADIKEFVKIIAGQESRASGLLPLIRRIEDFPKPVVMAIDGSAFGGGLELAMSGHYRVATRNAQLGQPEVKLGIIPDQGCSHPPARCAGKPESLCQQTRTHSIPSSAANFSSLFAMCPTPTAQ